MTGHSIRVENMESLGNFNGVIIEESLENIGVLENVAIISTRVEPVTEKHTPLALPVDFALRGSGGRRSGQNGGRDTRIADREHKGSWYADFKNESHHYIIFPDKIFLVDRRSAEQYDDAKHPGLSLGIPEHQVDFHPSVAEWEW